jgi:hypothetical protein
MSSCTTDSASTWAMATVVHMVPAHIDLDADDGTELLQARFDGLVAELTEAGVHAAHIRRPGPRDVRHGTEPRPLPNV